MGASAAATRFAKARQESRSVPRCSGEIQGTKTFWMPSVAGDLQRAGGVALDHVEPKWPEGMEGRSGRARP
jgi:hypothetical protein